MTDRVPPVTPQWHRDLGEVLTWLRCSAAELSVMDRPKRGLPRLEVCDDMDAQRGAEKMHAHREPAPRFSSHAWHHLGKRRRAMRDMHPSSRSHVTVDRASEICTAGMESIKTLWGSTSNAAALDIQTLVLSQST